MKILVTGGSGFIGSNLVDKLIAENNEVVIIEKQEPRYKNDNAIYYIMNLISPKIEQVFEKHNIDVVVHLAAQTSVAVSMNNPHADGNDNIFATLNLLKYCKKYNVSKIIASSSAAVYGEPKYLPVDEDHQIEPKSPYALSKFAMESYIKISGMDYMILRFANVYGPRQENSNESGVVSIFVNNILNNSPLNVFGDGTQTRDFIYVGDIVDTIAQMCEFKNKNYIVNLSTKIETSVNELISVLLQIAEKKSEINYLSPREGDIKDSTLCNNKMSSLGYKNKIALFEGLKNTYEFYKKSYHEERSILVIIPARGGSVGIPRKNLRNLNGKPLISYSIKNALKSKYSPDVYVSSDDEEILYISQKSGAQIYKRDASIADSQTTLDPVIYDAYKNISKANVKKYKLIITLQPTSPLLETNSLDEAIEKMIKNPEIDTLISAKNTTHLTWLEDGEKFIPNYEKRLNRQFLPPMYTETGGFLITRDSVISESSRIGENTQLYVLKNSKETIDIDTYEDFHLASYYLKRKKILFVVAGYNEIGFGHIYRTLLLASNITTHELVILTTKDSSEGYEKLKNYNFKVKMQKYDDIVDDILEINPDAVINDILNTDAIYMKQLKDKGIKLINFEDMGEGTRYADMVVNALYPNNDDIQNAYFGSKYFCARDEFILSSPKEITEEVKNILITFGGTDPNNLTLKVVKSINDYCITNSINIDIVLGFGYQNLSTLEGYKNINIHRDVKNISDFMSKADLIFTSCGRTVYEIACIGTPSIALAQNDREMTHYFASEKNGFLNLGLGANITEDDILKRTKDVITNVELRKNMNQKMLSKNLRKGTRRVIKLILDTVEGNV